MEERVINDESCLAEGASYLSSVSVELAEAIALVGPLSLHRSPDGFGRLLSAIVSQQLSVAAASSIWNRLKKSGLTGPRKISWASDQDLAKSGLSRQKIRYARALAESGVNYKALRKMKTEEVIERLTRVSGIGNWTAEIYTMFSLGRADVFAPGDLALQEAARMLFRFERRPNEKEFREMSLVWSPWRSVAARILWAYYRLMKERDGVR